MSTQKESIDKLIKTMKDWQKIEDASVKNTTEIIKITRNPLINIIMEIIRQDSMMHRRVQQIIVDNYEKHTITISPEELTVFWDMIEDHNAIEKRTIELAKQSLKETNSQLVNYLLDYLLTDETKHDRLLEELEKIKKGVYPYGEIQP